MSTTTNDLRNLLTKKAFAGAEPQGAPAPMPGGAAPAPAPAPEAAPAPAPAPMPGGAAPAPAPGQPGMPSPQEVQQALADPNLQSLLQTAGFQISPDGASLIDPQTGQQLSHEETVEVLMAIYQQIQMAQQQGGAPMPGAPQGEAPAPMPAAAPAPAPMPAPVPGKQADESSDIFKYASENPMIKSALEEQGLSIVNTYGIVDSISYETVSEDRVADVLLGKVAMDDVSEGTGAVITESAPEDSSALQDKLRMLEEKVRSLESQISSQPAPEDQEPKSVTGLTYEATQAAAAASQETPAPMDPSFSEASADPAQQPMRQAVASESPSRKISKMIQRLTN
jgi:hypothetical protein